VREGAWKIAGDAVRPEDAVSPEGASGTRTICRDSRSRDTDTKSDWHIVPLKGSTFGKDNSDAVYEPRKAAGS